MYVYASYSNTLKSYAARCMTYPQTRKWIPSFTFLFAICVDVLKHVYVLFLTSDNEFSGIISTLFRDRQKHFLTIFSIKFVIKCATKILKIG